MMRHLEACPPGSSVEEKSHGMRQVPRERAEAPWYTAKSRRDQSRPWLGTQASIRWMPWDGGRTSRRITPGTRDLRNVYTKFQMM